MLQTLVQLVNAVGDRAVDVVRQLGANQVAVIQANAEATRHAEIPLALIVFSGFCGLIVVGALSFVLGHWFLERRYR